MIQPTVKARLEAILNWSVEDADQERRRVASEALLTRRQRQMVYVKEGVYRDTSLITYAEYQVFLNEQQKQGRYYPARSLEPFFFSKGVRANSNLGSTSVRCASILQLVNRS